MIMSTVTTVSVLRDGKASGGGTCEGLTEELINCIDDPVKLRQLFSDFYRKVNSMEKHYEQIVSEQTQQLEEARSRNTVFTEEFYKYIYDSLEQDFNCSICSELFIQPAVLECGHTFCYHCIGRWKNGGNRECPICRKSNFRPLIKQVGMDNFIKKVHEQLSTEMRNHRDQVISEREREPPIPLVPIRTTGVPPSLRFPVTAASSPTAAASSPSSSNTVPLMSLLRAIQERPGQSIGFRVGTGGPIRHIRQTTSGSTTPTTVSIPSGSQPAAASTSSGAEISATTEATRVREMISDFQRQQQLYRAAYGTENPVTPGSSVPPIRAATPIPEVNYRAAVRGESSGRTVSNGRRATETRNVARRGGGRPRGGGGPGRSHINLRSRSDQERRWNTLLTLSGRASNNSSRSSTPMHQDTDDEDESGSGDEATSQEQEDDSM